MAVSRPQLQQRIPFVDGQGRLSNEGLRALNDALGSLFGQIQQIAELYGITDVLGSDVAGISSAPVLLADDSASFLNGRKLQGSSLISVTDGGPGNSITVSLGEIDTDDVPEGTGNLYFTATRARNSLSSGAGLAYDAATGVIAAGAILAAYAGGDTPSAFTLSIVDSADAAAWRTAIAAVPTSRSISTGTGLVGGGNLTADRTLSLATSGVTAGSYGSATKVPTITVDVYGRVTIVSENTIPALAAANYTPALTGIANVSGSSVGGARYSRTGDIVTISGRIVVTPTAGATRTDINVSLPIPSNFTTSADLSGSAGHISGSPNVFGACLVFSDATNDTLRIAFSSSSTSDHTITFTAQYTVQ